MLRGLGESAFVAVRRWAHPREREIRKRRRARRRSIRYSAASGATAIGAAGLAVVAAPVWAVVITSSGAVALVLPAALATRKYLRLKAKPLPPAGAQVRALPPVGSAARGPMVRLAKVEKSLTHVLAVVARSAPVPADELAETAAAAESAADALHALSIDIVSLEQAAKLAGQAAFQLQQSVMAARAELDSGLREYEHLLQAAARMTVSQGALPRPSETANLELRVAADRLDGWAEALAELAGAPRAIGPGPTSPAAAAGSG